MASLNIAICGCGPAGLSAALLLNQLGHRVRLFEQFAAPQPVGSGLLLQPTGMGVLAQLELLKPVAARGAVIDRLYGVVTASQRVALDVRYAAMGAGWRALGIHRSALFDALYADAVKHSLPIETATRIGGVRRESGLIALLDDHGRRLGAFDLVVNALGAHSPLSAHIARRTALDYGALWANVPWPGNAQGFNYNRLEQRYRNASHMAGLLPIGKAHGDGNKEAAFFWSIKRAALPAWRSASIAEWKQDVAALWPDIVPLLVHVETHAQLTLAQYDHFTARTPYDDRLAHIGDAAHATSPQLGQGANMALLDAYALSLALKNHTDVAAALLAYATMRRWHIRLFQLSSAIFTPFYQSDSRLLPWLRDWITAPLSRMPIGDRIVARLVSGMTIQPIAGAEFVPIRLGSSHSLSTE